MIDAIYARRSIRKYKETPIDKETIETILKAGMYAPSAKNRQPWKYYVYQGENKENLCKAMEKGLIRERDEAQLLPKSAAALPDAFNTLRIMREAPVLIIIENTNCNSPYESTDSDGRLKEICDSLSIGASVENILLTATELGIGSLWIANTCFAYNELVDFIRLQGQLVGAITLGIPAESPNMRPRKNASEIIEFK